VTPFVLERIVAATGGRSVEANIALAANNAGVAGRLAAALAGLSR
jgi:pseudouridine-5'-phosphate glycosidase